MTDPIANFISELSHPDEVPRCVQAIIAIGELAETAQAAIPALLKLVDHPEDRIRHNTIWALGRMGKKPEFIPIFLSALNDKDFRVRINAIWALGDLEELAKVYVPQLEVLLQDEDLRIQKTAKRSLEKISKKT